MATVLDSTSTALDPTGASEEREGDPGDLVVGEPSPHEAGGSTEGLRRPAFLGARRRPRALVLGLRASVPIALVLTWWLGTRQGWIPDHILSPPGDVWQAFTELRQSGDLTDYVVASFWRATIGLAFGLGVGLALGVAAGLTATGEDLIDPTLQMVRAVPFLALVPLYLAWFGVDETFKVVLIATSSAVPMYTYTYLGVRNVDRKVVEAARGFGLNRFGLVRRVVVPLALPNVLMALRICLVLSMTALISAESIGTEEGIGYLVLLARQYARTDYTVLCIVLYALLGIVFDIAIRLVERFSMPWRRYTAVRG
jgi:sulfonate transport system permease protein